VHDEVKRQNNITPKQGGIQAPDVAEHLEIAIKQFGDRR
jgi:hypothetical protein